MTNIVPLKDVLRAAGSPNVDSVSEKYTVNLTTGRIIATNGLPLSLDAGDCYNCVIRTGSLYRTRISKYDLARYVTAYKKLKAPKKVAAPSDTVTSTLKTGSFVVGSIVDGVLKLGSNPAIHDTKVKANTEAARLAGVAPGTQFVVLNVTGMVQSGGVVWK